MGVGVGTFWFYAIAALVAAIAVGLVFRRVLLNAALRARHSERVFARMVAVIALPAAFAVPLVFAAIAVRAAPEEGLGIELARQLLAILVVVCVVWAILRVIRAVERRVLRQHLLDVADNLQARRIHTQTRVVSRTAMTLVVILGVAGILMTIPGMRQLGAGLLASAGVVGLIAGFAAQPILGNLIAGLQIALAQPIRIDDVVIVDGEWGRIEEITSTYIVVAIWDQRRLVVPLRWFIEHPFQNWTRTSSDILGSVVLWLDYRTPMGEVRQEFERLCSASPHWDGRVKAVQVVECGEWSMQVRLLISAENSGKAFELRCEIREGILGFLQARFPESLPQLRMRSEELDSSGRKPPGSGTSKDINPSGRIGQ